RRGGLRGAAHAAPRGAPRAGPGRARARRDPVRRRPRRSAVRCPDRLSRRVAGGRRAVRQPRSLRAERRRHRLARPAVDGGGRRSRIVSVPVITPTPPGPPRSLRSLIIYGPGRNPLTFFSSIARTYGDIALVRMAGERL